MARKSNGNDFLGILILIFFMIGIPSFLVKEVTKPKGKPPVTSGAKVNFGADGKTLDFSSPVVDDAGVFSVGGKDSLNRFLVNLNDTKGIQIGVLVVSEMDGEDMDSVYLALTAAAEEIAVEQDKLITGFICDNFDNVLGPGVFMMVTAGYEYPALTPWIEDIMSKASDAFKNDAYVKEYMSAAQRNQNISNGMETPAEPPLQNVPVQQVAPPTPSDLAKPE